MSHRVEFKIIGRDADFDWEYDERYLAQMTEEGWELATATDTSFIFRRNVVKINENN